MDLSFALVSDLHFGPEALYKGKLRKLSAHAGRLLEEVVGNLRADRRPDFLVNLGDDIEDASSESDLTAYQECMGILARSGIDLVHVAGNHDTVNLTEADLGQIWNANSGWLSGARERTGKLFYSFDRGGVHFVVLHTREVKDRNVSVDGEQRDWLAQDLAATDLPVIVFMHHSAANQHLDGNRWFEGRANLCLIQERKELRRVFAEHRTRNEEGVLAVFNGHLHWNHLDVVQGIPYITLQSLIENLDDDAPGRPASAYAEVRLSQSRLVVQVSGAEACRYQFDRRRG